jgi:hypothetical protein
LSGAIATLGKYSLSEKSSFFLLLQAFISVLGHKKDKIKFK